MPSDQPIVFLNGTYLPKHQATISVEDRGTLFADGVYEVVRYYAGRPFEMDRHLARLERSLAGIRMAQGVDVSRFAAISAKVVARNGLADARVYWQITRGPAPRAHRFPTGTTPTVLVMAYAAPAMDRHAEPAAVRAITLEDRRWSDCWIKSLMLLPNVLARQQADDADCQEAILHRDGVVTEGAATSVFIVRDNALWTHQADRCILGGITRAVLIERAERQGLSVRQTSFTVEQMRQAQEVLLSGTTTEVAAVTHIDGQPIADARVGQVTRQLHDALLDHVAQVCSLDRS